jgi:hypothetical protein
MTKRVAGDVIIAGVGVPWFLDLDVRIVRDLIVDEGLEKGAFRYCTIIIDSCDWNTLSESKESSTGEVRRRNINQTKSEAKREILLIEGDDGEVELDHDAANVCVGRET